MIEKLKTKYDVLSRRYDVWQVETLILLVLPIVYNCSEVSMVDRRNGLETR